MGINRWFVKLSLGGLISIPVRAQCNCPRSQSSRCHKRLECACQNVSSVAAKMSPKPTNSPWNEKHKERFAVEPRVTWCRWCLKFQSKVYKSKQDPHPWVHCRAEAVGEVVLLGAGSNPMTLIAPTLSGLLLTTLHSELNGSPCLSLSNFLMDDERYFGKRIRYKRHL